MKLIKRSFHLLTLPLLCLIPLITPAQSITPTTKKSAQTLEKNQDNQQSIKITSDKFWANNIQGIAIYSGNVLADQSSRHLTGAKLTLYRNPQGQINKIIAEGEPAQLRYQPKDKLMTAQARTITVYPQKHMIHLDGKAQLTQAGDLFSAPQIFYNTQTQVLTTPESKQGRSHMVIEPKQVTTLAHHKAKP
ncbi:lipopolysaccharide transport periplasmic protein LptA [Piscirickettsia salmonis]|uniref:lipopolysaccharide transport periplasmic protein LptA n=1 Tax=Piscirickettsia salmonis TaxID=1238 RepID=UPI0006BD94E5|nr:lipopolysaccharide transport periplasmic protein LptA [Piscirickettsia salmonis]ALA24118.1 lipopolysaccharide transport periplasmic protein LptA [Piscirickettsia salmonis]QGO81443.1 lipopolysaccharide transport periplasmic protein LptA [Piscirickettsia salmonis]QGP23319.1 lipopolysaccharide transport periplasmic protein LptA [Piscirickettsia salmonis]QGP26699.1 lipopolysaccharide transport periplasmic protein LptA [Piscirickettsia salmonis]QGP30079.1 lipopolysaccharide transport periplasmic